MMSNCLMNHARVIPALWMMLLGGCGQIATVHSLSTAYTSPSAGETARLRVVSDGMVRAVPGRDCLDWNTPGAGVMVSARPGFADRNGEQLGMTGPVYSWAGAVSSELVIAANTPIAFHYLGQTTPDRQCFNTLTFVPRPGVDYQLQSSTSAQCAIHLQELPAGATQWVAVTPAPAGKLSMCHVSDNF